MQPDALEYALTRWAVEFHQRENFAAAWGASLHLGAWLAGWFTCVNGMALPADLGLHPASFRRGYQEAKTALAIEARGKR